MSKSHLHRIPSLAALVLASASLLSAGGCQLAGIIATGIEENTPVKVYSEYQGLKGKTYAIVIDADRSIQGRWPTLVPEIAGQIDQELAQKSEAAGHVPIESVILFQQENPRWTIMTRADLARALAGGEGQVERIILIEIFEFRLNEPGNRHLWDGIAAGSIAVLETDGPFPEEYAFHRPVTVGFPDGEGFGPDDFGSSLVATALLQRFSQRSAWLFFDHEEKYDTPY